MKIKKAICHQSNLDSPRFLSYDKLNDKNTNISPNNSNKINPNFIFNNLKAHLKYLQQASNKQSNKQSQHKSSAHLLARILKKNITKSSNPQQSSYNFYNSSILTPQQVVARQKSIKLPKNKSQILQSKRLNKKIYLQKIRQNQNHIFNIRYQHQQKQDESYNYSSHNQICKSNNQIHKSNNQYHKNNINTQNNDNQHYQINNSKQKYFHEIINKSNTKSTKNKIKTQSNSFVMLSTIKNKIQKYLVQQQSKLKQFKSNNLYSQNPKLVLQQKSNPKLKIINNQIKYNSKLQDGVFNSLSSLTRKKQTKFALDMIKRRLNFSMTNKSLKDRQALNKSKYSPSHKCSPTNKRDSPTNKKDSPTNKRDSPANMNSGMNIRKQMNYQQKKRYLMINSDDEQSIRIKKELIQSIQNQAQLLGTLQRQILLDLGIKIQKIQQINELKQLNHNNKLQHLNYQLMNNNVNNMNQRQKICKTQQNDLHNNYNQNPNYQKYNQNKQYLYSLYYYSPQQLINLNNISTNNQKSNKQDNSNQQNQSQYKIQKYQNWKKQNITHQKLTQLLNHNTTPLDPIQCYYNSFLNKPSSLQSINPIISHHNHYSPPLLHNSNSSSLSPLHKRTKKKIYQSIQKSNPQLQNNKLDQKIIFVSKKQKQNLQQKKLSNLLQKIQKRNSQIKKLGRVQTLQIFKSTKKNEHNRKINGLSINQYIQEENISSLTDKNMSSLNNFIVQWPKRQGIKQKQKQIGLKTKKINPKKNNPDDWTVFEPWIDNTNNELQLQVGYGQTIDNKQINSNEQLK